jgi:hypothetical protein
VAEFDSVIPAGGSGKLVAKTKTTPLRTRRLSKSITVTTDAEGAANVMLRFTFDAKAPIQMLPSDRLVVYSIEGEETRQRMLLRNTDGEKLEVSGVATEVEYLRASVRQVAEREIWNGIEAQPGDSWVELDLSADAPVGVHHGYLELTTNNPMAPSLRIPYLARVRKIISVKPEGARLWIAGSGDFDGASTFLGLEHNRGKEFKITDVSVSEPELFTAEAVSQDAARRHTLRVKLQPELTPESIAGTVQAWITIDTDVPESPVLKVPVLVAPTRAGVRRPFEEP